MTGTPLAIIMWKTPQESFKDDSSRRDFEFYFQNQKVGNSSARLCQNAHGLCGDKQFFPDNWFCNEGHSFQVWGESCLLKPFLEITNFDFSDFQGQGFGRMGLQMMYQLAKTSKAEGRISLIAQKKREFFNSPAPFYEHCGFQGIVRGMDERKYFNPIPENIQSLFSNPISPCFKVKEIPVKENRNSFVDPHTGQIKIPAVLKRLFDQKQH